MSQPFIVTFAGVPGSSKTIIAQHLSITFDLPVYSNDVVRSEVKEDLLVDDITLPAALEEYERRGQARHKIMFENGLNVICDFSGDRRWGEFKEKIQSYGYRWCLINMDMSAEFMENLYAKTSRFKAIEQLPTYMKQHELFVKEHGNDITVSISDADFKHRLAIAEQTVRTFLQSLD